MAERSVKAALLFGPDGQFIYSEENNRLVVELLKQRCLALEQRQAPGQAILPCYNSRRCVGVYR